MVACHKISTTLSLDNGPRPRRDGCLRDSERRLGLNKPQVLRDCTLRDERADVGQALVFRSLKLFERNAVLFVGRVTLLDAFARRPLWMEMLQRAHRLVKIDAIAPRVGRGAFGEPQF